MSKKIFNLFELLVVFIGLVLLMAIIVYKIEYGSVPNYIFLPFTCVAVLVLGIDFVEGLL